MGKLIDLTGRVFTRLTVLYRGENDKYNKPQWWCECSCSDHTLKLVRGNDLTTGKIKSCGCLIHDRPKKEKIKKEPIKDRHARMKIGEQNYNSKGTLMTIVEYNGTYDIKVRFEDEFHAIVQTGYGNFKKGVVRNPYSKDIYDVGYIGEGEYRQTKNRVATKAYDAWIKMLARCYSNNQEVNSPTYKGCSVCEEWHNFQNFAKWFEENIYHIEGQSMEVDKDWLIHGNKMYSPETCVIVPNIINTCILNHDRIKDLDLPTGISITSSGKYKARLSKYGKRNDLGSYEKLEDSMFAYMDAKISYIKELACKYKNVIPQKLYDVMNKYEDRFLLDNPDYSVLFKEAA